MYTHTVYHLHHGPCLHNSSNLPLSAVQAVKYFPKHYSTFFQRDIGVKIYTVKHIIHSKQKHMYRCVLESSASFAHKTCTAGACSEVPNGGYFICIIYLKKKYTIMKVSRCSTTSLTAFLVVSLHVPLCKRVE